MNRFLLAYLVWVSILSACASAPNEPEASPTSPFPPSVEFEFQGEDPSVPIITHLGGGSWPHKYVNPGAVIFHDGQFHMFRNEFTGWPGRVQVGYTTSPDGLNWSDPSAEPVFDSKQVPYLKPTSGADVGSVIVEDDGTWVIYFHTVNIGQRNGAVGRATAPLPNGPWTVDPEPVLAKGPEGAWDSRQLAWPSVLKTEGVYFMFYGAENDSGRKAIGLAISEDGITWTKYNDPATTEAPYADSDPVLQPGAEWERFTLDRPRVVYTPQGWMMIYQGGLNLNDRGAAFSRDGITWSKYPGNPALTQEDFPIPGTTWDTALVYADGVFYYIMEIGSMQGTDLYLAAFEGGINP